MTLAPAGYKLEDVPKVLCLGCRLPIGDLPYKEVAMFARFGKMSFVHVTCPEPTK